MILLVDIGNTRVKVSSATAAGLTPMREQGHDGEVAAIVLQLLELYPSFTEVWIASVHNDALRAQIEQRVQTRFHITPQWVVSLASGFGVTSGYPEPSSLGVDRFLALVGARSLVGNCPVCVIDCGTAVTIDYLDSHGVHQGGVIAPGLSLMRQSLQRGTARLAVIPSSDIALLANSTAGAMASGCLFSVVGLITHLLSSLKQTYSLEFDVILTGGDAWQVLPFLPHSAQQIDDLVLRGLAVVAGVK